MAAESLKSAAKKLVDRLPDDCTWDDLMHAIYVRQKMDAGLKDLDEGRFVDHEEIVREFVSNGSPLVAERPA